MPPPAPSGGRNYTFKPRISVGESLLSTSTSGIRAPKGLSASNTPAPIFISPEKMVSMLKAVDDPHSRGLGITHGLTTTAFSVSFSDFANQWKKVEKGSAKPFWQFQGGDIYFDATITVYVLEGDRSQPHDQLSRKIFNIIMEHELLHVADEVDIITNFAPEESYKDEMVKKYLTKAELMDDAMLHSWFRDDRFSKWIRDGVWAPEHNARKAIRDAPAQYQALGKQISDLRSQATIPKPHSRQ
jgi:hypothetical protein